MGEKPEEQVVFVTYNRHTWRIFYLTLLMQASLMTMMSISLLNNSSYRLPMMILAVVVAIICLVWEVIEIRKTEILRVDDNQMLYQSEIILPTDIEEIVFMKGNIDIRKKSGGFSVKLLRLSLKNREETENLKKELAKFGGNNQLKVRTEL